MLYRVALLCSRDVITLGHTFWWLKDAEEGTVPISWCFCPLIMDGSISEVVSRIRRSLNGSTHISSRVNHIAPMNSVWSCRRALLSGVVDM